MLPLKVESLTKIFNPRKWFLFKNPKKFIAIDNISFELNKGEILGFLGPNGAGKSTTIQMLLGILKPTSGKIQYFGKNFFTNRSDILKKVTFASSYIKLPGKLTVFENLDICARLHSIPYAKRIERINYLLNFLDIANLKNRLTGTLSAGQTTRVMLANAFIPHPEIILLDEPTASLDPDIAQEVRKFILQEQKNQGISVLFTSHNMDEVTQVCNRVLVLKNGKIIANNSPLVLASTISNARIHLTIVSGINSAREYVAKHNLNYKEKELDFEFQIDEQNVGPALIALATKGVIYTHVSIDKPTLEDYFLSISQNKK